MIAQLLLSLSVYSQQVFPTTTTTLAEELTGIPYNWSVYDLVVLPSSFPYGGMENPNATFLSMSLLAGDRSLTDVVAHGMFHYYSRIELFFFFFLL